MDALVHQLAAALALRGDDLIQLLLVKGFVPGKGFPAGHKLLQGGLEPVVVKGLDEVVRHAIGIQLTDVTGLAGSRDHDDIGQDPLGPQLHKKRATVHHRHVVVQHDEVHGVVPGKLQRILTILKDPGDGHFVVVLYILLVDLSDHRVVFHDNDLIHTTFLTALSVLISLYMEIGQKASTHRGKLYLSENKSLPKRTKVQKGPAETVSSGISSSSPSPASGQCWQP